MSVPLRLGLFAVGLLVAFAAATGLGRATGPVGPVGPADDRAPAHDGAHDADEDAGHDAGHDAPSAVEAPGGLATSQDGYTLVLDEASYEPGTRELAFRIEDETGAAVVDYDVEHEKLLHLVVVRRDFTGFQHVHPELDESGTWRVPVELTPGAWRVLADVVPRGGDDLVLGADLAVAGTTGPPPPTPVVRSATVDGYTVTLAGDLVAGDHSELTLAIEKDGEPVTDLDPYLGAYGHLVALREGDLAYLHVHPEEGEPGPTVAFAAEVPSAGRYHLYLDFRHDGVVRTATFTVEADHDDH